MWTNDLAKQWDALCSMPIFQAGLAELERRCRVTPVPLPAGYDALVLAAGEHHRKVGQGEVLKFIQEMRSERNKTVEPLPAPFTAAARAEHPKPQ